MLLSRVWMRCRWLDLYLRDSQLFAPDACQEQEVWWQGKQPELSNLGNLFSLEL